MSYQPSGQSVEAELQRISEALEQAVDHVTLRVLTVAPARPRDGVVVCADGTLWNPGSGAGIYARIAGSWVKL